MDVQINMWAVLLATASTMVVGFVWYAPKVFGKTWMKLIGKKQKDLAGSAVPAIVGTIVVSFLSAYILAHVTFLSHEFFRNSFMQDALTTGFWLWLGFVAARFVTHDLFERRPLRLTILNLSHEFVTVMVMALIIGWLQP